MPVGQTRQVVMSVTAPQSAFYIVMFKKEKFIPQMCILFYNQLWVGWEDGRWGGQSADRATAGNPRSTLLPVNVFMPLLVPRKHKEGLPESMLCFRIVEIYEAASGSHSA